MYYQAYNPVSARAVLTAVSKVTRILVVLASALLVAAISVDAFATDGDILLRGFYRSVQLPVCVVFLIGFFVDMYVSPRRARYFFSHLIILVLSIPYTAIVGAAGVKFGATASYVIHFVPTVRAVMALVVLVVFISKNRLVGFFLSYVLILALMVYFSSLIFFLYEGAGANPGVVSYWTALWWCVLQATTLGASFYACTTVGKAVAMALSVTGVMMFPVFTVYFTGVVRKYLDSYKKK